MKVFKLIPILVLLIILLGCNSSDNIIKLTDTISFKIPEGVEMIYDTILEDKHVYRMGNRYYQIFIASTTELDTIPNSQEEKTKFFQTNVKAFLKGVGFNRKMVINSESYSTEGIYDIALINYTRNSRGRSLHEYTKVFATNNSFVLFLFSNNEKNNDFVGDDRIKFFEGILVKED